MHQNDAGIPEVDWPPKPPLAPKDIKPLSLFDTGKQSSRTSTDNLASPPSPVVNTPLTEDELAQASHIDFHSPAFISYAVGIGITLVGTIVAIVLPALTLNQKAMAGIIAGVIIAVLTAVQQIVSYAKSAAGVSGIGIVGRVSGKLLAGE